LFLLINQTMNRNRFIATSFFAALLPFTTFAKTVKDFFRNDKGFKVDAGKDRFDKPISLFEGDTFFTKVSAKDTDGDLYMFESIRDKKGGPPLHIHYTQDEYWYILEGEFLFKVGEETFTAKKGDTVFGPRMVAHAFAKTNQGPARLLMAFQPAGKMEAHFKAVSDGVYASLSDKEKDTFRKQNGFEVVGAALTHEK
jgi:mannose-6-phosphate isomerase-like protein (cupin superfamily)